MSGVWIGAVLLTIINIVVLWFTYRRAPQRRIAFNLRGWRVSLAIAPTPMLGVAGSYGVYAFNLWFMPWIWSMIMASALELTYIGLACLDGLTVEQRARAQLVAKRAAWISYAENVLAGLFYALPALVAEVQSWHLWWQVVVWLPLAALHGSLVYVGFTVTNLTLHRPDAQEKTPAPATGATQVLQPKIAAVPLPQMAYPAPQPIAPAAAPTIPAPAPAAPPAPARAPRRARVKLEALPLPAADATADAKAAWVLAMVNERGWKQSELADMMNCSRQWIGDLYHGRYKNKVIGGGK